MCLERFPSLSKMPTYQERVISLLAKSPVEVGKALYKMIESNPTKASQFITAYACKAASTEQIKLMIRTIGEQADKKQVFVSSTINALRWSESTGRREDRIFPLVDLPTARSAAIREATAEWRAPHEARADLALARAQEDPAWNETLTP
jgi:hypothetical protein